MGSIKSQRLQGSPPVDDQRFSDGCYDRGAPLFFSNTTRQLGTLLIKAKTDLDQKKKKLL